MGRAVQGKKMRLRGGGDERLNGPSEDSTSQAAEKRAGGSRTKITEEEEPGKSEAQIENTLPSSFLRKRATIKDREGLFRMQLKIPTFRKSQKP